MGYLFLTIALSGGLLKAYCGKYVSTVIKSESDSMLFNLLRMVLCAVIGFFIAFISGGSKIFHINGTVLAVTLMSGLFSALFVILWMLAVNTGAYTMVDVFIMGGTLIPMLGSAVLFNEKIGIVKFIGFAVVVSGIIVISSYNNSIKRKITPKQLVLLLFVALSSGFADFSQKLFADLCSEVDTAIFNFYTYLFASLFIFIMLAFKKVETNRIGKKIKSVFAYILLMAVGLFVNSYFKVEAARFIEAVKLYPLNQGAALFLGMLMASVFFGEKITVKCVAGVLLGFIGICMINLL